MAMRSKPANRIPNDIIIVDEFSLGLILTDRTFNVKGVAVIDVEDYKPPISTYRWSLRSDGYAYNFQLGRLHHNILQKPKKPLEVDHIDRNRLNNRRENLRIVSKRDQQLNRNIQSNNTSGMKNISWSEERQKWIVQIYNKDKKIQKRFSSKEEAKMFLLNNKEN